ncbi:immunoglobulin superfamily containing leucine-rich repeat protein 2 [Fundulus heteroclitus]|uniref:immunoglobulin superfamily containing leucine-rich repeat protein 2 n=1 Tax=Fundulus heteroclitus TaxID=8078 RepID=UPI00165B0025|nr:immunoglobulin superfamily containing leucine-rich repeat protein 2 [Fundulus heteroclitus]
MAAADIRPFALWVITFFPSVLCCPEHCTCSDKHSRHFADCSYKYLSKVPDGLPPNVMTLSLSGNQITMIPLGSFDNVTNVTSLWMANNDIAYVEDGSLASLVHLRNFDISHNEMVDFPWGDLRNLMALELLKMNHNKLSHLPGDALSNLKNLRSLRINNNRLTTIAEGTFEGLVSLSHLQIFSNPFVCTCSLDWLRDWISTTTISVPDQSLITCAAPKELKGEAITKSKCMSLNVKILTEPHVTNMVFREKTKLNLTCEFRGNPKPLVVWKTPSRGQKHEVSLSDAEDRSAESDEGSDYFKVFNNGTLLISSLREEDGGDYTCSATNGAGRAEDSVSVKVIARPKPKPTPVKLLTTMFPSTQTNPSMHQQPKRKSVFDSLHLPDLKRKDPLTDEPTVLPTADINLKFYEDATRHPTHLSKCGLTANTKNISSHVLNASLDYMKQYTFDYGVIALGVSETEATVRLNPLLIPKDRSPNRAKSPQSDSEENSGFPDSQEKDHSSGLYLCNAGDNRHSAVQWSQIKEGVNTYLFSGLQPGTNYSLCLNYRGEDCEVQVLFATRRRVPNLLIIISVSICLLTVSTVPLLGATCYHLVYKYRNKTYKLILKAKGQYHLERNLAANLSMHAHITESQRKINEDDTSVDDGEREADTEESVVTESFTCKGNMEDCEMGSEYSDRLPLGAEAGNITSNYKYPDD